MQFFNEFISDEDKAKFDWDQFKPSPASQPVGLFRWTINEERDVFFMQVQGPGRGNYPSMYVLYWKGAVIKVTAVEKPVSSPKTPPPLREDGIEKSDLYWDVRQIVIPKTLEAEQSLIVETLKEVLEASGGTTAHRERIDDVYISFDSMTSPNKGRYDGIIII